MAVLDTLEVIIEADASGLTSVFRSAVNTMTGFVDQMNSQQVNWTKILSESLSPAIITGIASTFALAIASAVQFQNQMTNVSNNTNDTMGQSSADISNSILGMAANIGASGTDAATAYNQFNKLFNNSADATAAIADAQNLAIAAHMSLGDVMQMLIPLFQNWGVTTLPAAQSAMTGLANAASIGKFSLGELVDTISQAGTTLRNSTDITTTSLQLQDLSNQAGETKTSTKDLFDSMVQYMSQPTSSITLLSGGVEGLGATIRSDGVMGAINQLGTTITGLGPLAASAMGVATTQFQDFGRINDTVSKQVIAAADQQKLHLASLAQLAKDNITPTQELANAWNTLVDTLNMAVGGPFLSFLAQAVEGINTMVDDLTSGKFQDTMKDLGIDSPGKFLTNIGSELSTISSSFLNNLHPAGNSVGSLVGAMVKDAALTPGQTILDVLGQSGIGPNAADSGGSGGMVSQTNNYNITAAKGSETAVANGIAKQTYNNFNNLNSGSPQAPFSTGSGVK